MKIYKILIIISLVLNLTLFIKAEEKFKYDSKGNRDPFVELVNSEGVYRIPFKELTSAEDIHLEGIIWDSEGESMAVINGEILAEGQEFEGVQVYKIFPKKIVILMEGREITINLMEEGQ